jgi:hypothetical protein
MSSLCAGESLNSFAPRTSIFSIFETKTKQKQQRNFSYMEIVTIAPHSSLYLVMWDDEEWEKMLRA